MHGRKVELKFIKEELAYTNKTRNLTVYILSPRNHREYLGIQCNIFSVEREIKQYSISQPVLVLPLETPVVSFLRLLSAHLALINHEMSASISEGKKICFLNYLEQHSLKIWLSIFEDRHHYKCR